MSEEDLNRLAELETRMQNIQWEQEQLKEKYVEVYGQWYLLWSKLQREKESENA